MGKGQISLFVIIGAVIIILFSLIFYFGETGKIQANEVNLQEMQAQKLLQTLKSCIDSVSYEEAKNMSKFGGFTQSELNEGNAIKIADSFIPVWNAELTDISPDIAEIESKLSTLLSDKAFKCFRDVYKEDLEIVEGNLSVVFLDDHFEVGFNGPVKAIYLGEKTTLPETSSRFNYNIKRDFEIAKKILADSIAAQPAYYDITMSCNDYRTNGKTNIYTIEVLASKEEHITILSVIDYEPILRDKEDALRINFALRNINVMGFCAG